MHGASSSKCSGAAGEAARRAAACFNDVSRVSQSNQPFRVLPVHAYPFDGHVQCETWRAGTKTHGTALVLTVSVMFNPLRRPI